ncbi:MAG: hypothetical protein CVV25_06750 [Ignavibacteriae bacterium HGW-Ignavibacteriae-4]|jgi:hypothetical protein|nr:MAG: hypothetical protein CVV25_06750 [Ignavibacteriae bacterium HGW-Ignavibacteriae-4]
MNIEFKIKDESTILLKPVKKELENNLVHFELVDNEKNVWLELELIEHGLNIIFISIEIIDDKEFIESKLDELYSQIIEVEKSGADSYFENEEIELNPYDPEKIKVRSDKIPITLIAQMIDNGDIDMTPDFQRHLVWNNYQKSLLIESILLRIPLPMFYFAEDKEGKLSIVDGLQRISTIKEYMDNKFPLKNLQYLEANCGGKYYKSEGNKKGLDSKYLRWFNLTNLSANIIDPTSPFKVKYDIFRRINTGGKPLNNQEIRNCLTGQGLRDVLKEMVKLPEFLSATDKSIKSTRMDDQEIALRFLVFYSMFEKYGNIDKYTGYMDSTLDEFTELNIKSKSQELVKFIPHFSNSMKNAEYLLGKKCAFRKILPKDTKPDSYKQLINKALFVCMSILFAKYDYSKLKKLNLELKLQEPVANKINADKDLFAYLSYGTNGKANLTYTFKVLQELFNQHINY